MEELFKEGEYVFYPQQSIKPLKLFLNSSGGNYPLNLVHKDNTFSFTEDGKFYLSDTLPSIFKVTEENANKLSQFYGVEFEYTIPSYLDEALKEGKKVLCLCAKNKIRYLGSIPETALITTITGKLNTGHYIDKYCNTIPKSLNIYPIQIKSDGEIIYLD